MEPDNPKRQNTKKIFGLLLALDLLIIAGLVYVFLDNRKDDHQQTVVNNQSQQQDRETGQDTVESTYTETQSGLGTFSVMFPDGWKNIIRDTGSDFFWIGGDEQPETQPGVAPEVKDVAGFGTDSSSVFTMSISEGGTAYVEEDALSTPFTMTNDKENPIQGTKYYYEFAEDTPEGIGYIRLKGDKNYTYVFELGDGDVLTVRYSVYGKDPRNNVLLVEEILNSIRFN